MAVRIDRRKTSKAGLVLPALIITTGVVFAGVIVGAGGRAPGTIEVLPAPVVAQFDMIELPVPIEPVAAGVKLGSIKLLRVAFPKHQVPPAALTDLALYADAVTLTALPARLPIFAENISRTAGLSNPVVERIPSGMRAMTIKVDATSAVEGWAGSGSVVDVLLVEKDKTAVIAEAVQILSAERSVSPVEGSAAPKLPSTVTLLVSQEQCLAINTAIPRGKIAFALRSAQDTAAWISTTYTADQLRSGTAPGTGETPEAITGFAALSGGDEGVSFALAGGRWTRTNAVPRGFLVGREQVGEAGKSHTDR